MEVSLYNSTVCRLCGEENDNGTLLYTNDDNNQELSEIINTYLPLKVSDDGKLPRTICPGCTIQVEATVEFFNLIIKGQKILRELHERELEYKRSITREIPETEVIAEKIVYEIKTSDGVYHVEHPISLQVAGLDKPKRKRGRPSKKCKSPEELAQEAAAAIAAKEEEARQQALRAQEDNHGKRRRKTPPRLKEAVQGRELEKIFIEEGVIDKAESEPDTVVKEDESAALESDLKTIGHVAASGEPVIVHTRQGRGRPRGVRGPGRLSRCAQCGLEFATVGRYMSHIAMHKTAPPIYPTNRNDNSTANMEVKDFSPKSAQPDTPLQVKVESNEAEDPLADLEVETQTSNSAQEDGKPKTIPSETGKKQLKCNHCDKMFSTRQSKSMHIKAVHRGEKPYRCGECGQAFPYPRSLALHALAHRRRRAPPKTGYACDVCHKVLNHPSSVMYHKQAVHGATQYVCGECGKSFHHRQLLQRHQLVHSQQRPFNCELCPARFKTKANLRNHLLLHSGVKKFECGICHQRFSHKTSLTLHMRWHTGSKPFSCDTCGKRFSQKGNLAEHERIHTGEKPYICAVCHRRFTTSSQLRLHTRRHMHVELPTLKERAEQPSAPQQTPETSNSIPQESKKMGLIVTEQEEGGDVIYVTYDSTDASAYHIIGSEVEDVEDNKVLATCELYPPSPLVEQQIDQPVNQLALQIPQMSMNDSRSPLRLRMRDGSILALTSIDGETLQILTQDGQSIPVEVNNYEENVPDGVNVSEVTSSELVGENAPPAHYYTIV